MVTVWITIAIIHLGSLLFIYAFVKRLIEFVKKNQLTESKYTLLFGWIRLSHIVVIYSITMLMFFILSSYILIFVK
jgi:hypothetical protein